MATYRSARLGALVSRPDRGSFEELVEHGDRTVPVVRNRPRLIGVADVQSLHEAASKRPPGRFIRAKLRAIGPYLMLLAGLGCLTVSVWPQLLPTVGCALFALSTVWSLVRCVR